MPDLGLECRHQGGFQPAAPLREHHSPEPFLFPAPSGGAAGRVLRRVRPEMVSGWDHLVVVPEGVRRPSNLPDGHGLGHALEGRVAQISSTKVWTAPAAPSPGRSPRCSVRPGLPGGRNAGRFAQGQLLVPALKHDVSDDHRSRDAKPDGELHAVAGLQTRIQPRWPRRVPRSV